MTFGIQNRPMCSLIEETNGSYLLLIESPLGSFYLSTKMQRNSLPPTSKVNISRLSIEDKPMFRDALELLNRTQGRDLFGPSYLDERTASPLSLVLGAFRSREVVVVGVAELINNYDYYLPFQPNLYEELSGKVVGSFSTLCVHESLQGRGIGYQISQKRLAWLRSKGCHVVLGVSWVSGLAHTSDRLFEKMGFQAVRKVENFYHKSSLEHPFICPGCGDPPCTCAAILYKLNLA